MSRLSELANSSEAILRLRGGQARFHLAAAWLAAGRRDLASGLIPQVLPAARGVRQFGQNIGSPVRDRAILLSTLLAVQPDHPALPALAQELADAGRRGHWSSTQDTAFAVMALGRYLGQTAAAAPFIRAELLLDGRPIATNSSDLFWSADGFPGASAASMPPGSKLTVRLAGPSDCRGYASWLHTGVPLHPPADVDSGMKIRRRYLDERGQPLRLNMIHSGDLVQVELTIEATAALDQVVIEDLLPAGLEIENPRIVTQVPGGLVAAGNTGPSRFQDRRLDMRDDRLILIGALTEAGDGRYVYTARAVAPGTFVIPPVKAECMYDSGTCSLNGGGTWMRVLPVPGARVADVRDASSQAE